MPFLLVSFLLRLYIIYLVSICDTRLQESTTIISFPLFSWHWFVMLTRLWSWKCKETHALLRTREVARSTCQNKHLRPRFVEELFRIYRGPPLRRGLPGSACTNTIGRSGTRLLSISSATHARQDARIIDRFIDTSRYLPANCVRDSGLFEATRQH